MYYIGKAHQYRFLRAVSENPHKCPKEYLAVLYLLSADHDLWLDTQGMRKEKAINFTMGKYLELTADQYTLYKAAQDIYAGTSYINLQDLGDYYAIPERIASAILESLIDQEEKYAYC